MRKQGFQISFTWLFAIIVGMIILFLAIYAATKIIDTGQLEQDAKTGKDIGVLLNPLETGFESAKTASLTMPVETRIYSRCSLGGYFGTQTIQISQKSFNQWSDTDIRVGFENKYIFSDEYEEGRVFYIFSKPFEFPFKVADLIYLVSSKKTYCFVDAPEDINEELETLNQPNLALIECSDNDITVCFEKSGCDISVNYIEDEYLSSGSVEKNGKRVYFESDALMYAGIFGSEENYECGVRRLMQRISNSAALYKDKAEFVSQKNCDTNLNLIALKNSADKLESSANLGQMRNVVEDIGNKNDLAVCGLW